MLFNIYMKPLGEVFQGLDWDLSLKLSLFPLQLGKQSKLHQCLVSVMGWDVGKQTEVKSRWNGDPVAQETYWAGIGRISLFWGGTLLQRTSLQLWVSPELSIAPGCSGVVKSRKIFAVTLSDAVVAAIPGSFRPNNDLCTDKTQIRSTQCVLDGAAYKTGAAASWLA